MSIPYRKTIEIDGFIGQDRPIYGNELLPEGGCLPPGYGPGVILNEGQSGNQIFLWEMTDYSGGSLTSAFIDTNTSTDFDYHSSYYINTPLSGINYPAYQGYGELFGTAATLIMVYNVDDNGYVLAVWAYTPNEINPIYGGNATSTIITDVGTSKNAPTIINDTAYLPNTINSNGDLPVSYTGTSCQQITPTPTPTPGLIPSATPTPTPSITPSITSTPSATPSVTPTISITPSATFPGCSCFSYQISNNDTESGGYYWYNDCNDGTYHYEFLAPLTVAYICGCNGTVGVGSPLTLSSLGSCDPTPTPTSTPPNTPTPTPSPTGYQYVYDTFNCDDALDTRRFASNTFLVPGKVVRGSVLADCYEVTGQSSLGIYDDVVLTPYTDCGSCPR